MAMPIIEVAIGTPDGIQQFFQTSRPYRPRSVQYFLNGQAKRADWADGWTEMGGSNVRLRVAPKANDVVQFLYVPL